MRFLHVQPNAGPDRHLRPFVGVYADIRGTHRFVEFGPGDFAAYHKRSGPLEPASLAAWLLYGPGIDAFRMFYGLGTGEALGGGN